jgi:hypothetical protein
MVTSPTIVTVLKPWNPLLHKYGFNYHTTKVWLTWLPNLKLDSPTLTAERFAPTSEVLTSAVFF